MKKYCYNPKRTLTVLLGSVGVATALGAAPQIALAETADTATDPVATVDSESTKRENAVVTDTAVTAHADTDTATTDVTSPATDGKTDATEDNKAADASDKESTTDSEEKTDEKEESKVPERTIEDTSAVIGTKMDDTHVLDAKGASTKDGTEVNLWESNAGFNQKWDISYDEKTGYYYVAMHNTKQVLDIMYASNKPGSKVTLYHKTGGDNQLWAVEEKNGYYRFISKLNSNLVLNIAGANKSNGAQLIVWNKSGAANEWFRFLALHPEVAATAKEDAIEDGLYTITSGKINNNVVVSTAYGENAALAKKSDASSQRIYVKSDGKGYYTLLVSSTGKYLGTQNGNLVATTPVIESAYTGSNAQKWALRKLSNGGYTLINKANGLALDVMYDAINAGSRLDTYYTKGSALNQSFFFNKIKNIAADAESVIIEDGRYLIQSTADGTKVVGPKDNSKQDAMIVVKSNAQFGNVFQFKRIGKSDYYNIILDGTNKYLDVQYNSAADNGKIGIYKATGGDNQQWRLVKINGAYSLVSKLRPDLVVDLQYGSTKDNNQAIVWRATGNANQLFNLLNATVSVPDSVEVEEGVYNFNIGGTGKAYLDIAGMSTSDGGNALGYAKTGGANQKFYLKKINSKNYYNIISINSGKLLDVAGSYMLPGTNVLQWNKTGGDNQKWAAVANPDGSYSFVNVATGLYLTLDGTLKSGNNIVASSQKAGLLNQMFKLEKTQYINDGIFEVVSKANAGKVLDIVGASNANGAKLEIWKDNNGLNQRYQVVYDADTDVYRIRTGASGGWLTTASDSLKSSVIQNGTSKTEANDNNSWKAIWNGDYFSLKNVATGGVLAITGTYDGAMANTVAASGSALQHFFFNAAGLVKDGLYQIISKVNNMALDVTGDSRSAGANVGVWTNKKSGNQKFNIKSYNGYYVIEAALAKKNVTVSGSSTNKGANVIIDGVDYAADQLWTAEIADGGGVIFVNKKSGLALTASAGNVVQNAKDVSARASDVWQLVESFLSGWNWEGSGWRYYYENGNSAAFSNNVYNAYQRIKNTYSSTNYLISVDRDHYRTIVFRGSAGKWEPVYDWLNAVGSSKPGFGVTATGEFSILRKGYVMGNDPDYYYWMEYWVPRWSPDGEGQRFHSIAYYRNTNFAVFDGRLGMALTHGCVRMATENVKWMYYNCPIGTKVIIY